MEMDARSWRALLSRKGMLLWSRARMGASLGLEVAAGHTVRGRVSGAKKRGWGVHG